MCTDRYKSVLGDMVLKLEQASEAPGGFGKQMAGPHFWSL